MKRIFRTLILTMATLPLVEAEAMDLPVKTINGKQFYYYTVKKSDTIYSLVNTLGITRNELVKSNPSAADILKEGDVLYFSVDEFGGDAVSAVEPEQEVAPVEKTGVVYHKVKKGETLYGISRQYDVNQEEIVSLNPNARYGVKAGSMLKIPVMANDIQIEPEDPEPEVTIAPEAPETAETGGRDVIVLREETAELAPVRPSIEVEPSEEVSDPEMSEAVEDSVPVVNESGPYSIAVMLPFMLESENPSRQAMLYTDFYKGLMVAADTLSNRGDTVRIFAYDTKGDINRVRELLKDDNVKGASVIIAPDDIAQIGLIADAVNDSVTKVLNVFNVKDSSYVSKPSLLQANIPHRKMYAKALDAINRYYPDRVPVILRNEAGRSDKAEFIALLTEAYKAKSIEPIEITYDGALMSSHLDALPDDGTRYLLIPTSGSLAEFNKFSHAVRNLKDSSADSDRIVVFGYPDWTAFRSDAESMLHMLDAVVYSRFYYDEKGFDARSLNEAFNRWFGEPMIEVVPNQGMLGFDVGNLLIRNIRNNDGYFDPQDGAYEGAQSSFRFEPGVQGEDAETGLYNDEIYILRFKPDGRVERLSL